MGRTAVAHWTPAAAPTAVVAQLAQESAGTTGWVGCAGVPAVSPFATVGATATRSAVRPLRTDVRPLVMGGPGRRGAVEAPRSCRSDGPRIEQTIGSPARRGRREPSWFQDNVSAPRPSVLTWSRRSRLRDEAARGRTSPDPVLAHGQGSHRRLGLSLHSAGQ